MPPVGEIRIRPAKASDAAGVARVQVEAWRDAYVGILPDEALIGMGDVRSAQRWSRVVTSLEDPALFSVAVWKRSVIGFCHGGSARRGTIGRRRLMSREGEVFTLYVDPNFQGMGIGSTLMFRVVERMAAVGFAALTISTLTGNRHARRFYERLGGVEGEETPSVVMGVPASETPYHWDDIMALLSRLEEATN